MAKTTGPLFSLTAKGSLKKSIIFSEYRGITRVKKWAQPSGFVDKKTPAQLAARAAFSVCFNNWQIYPPIKKAQKNAKAKNLQMSGFNLFMKECISRTVVIPVSQWELPFNLDDDNTSA